MRSAGRVEGGYRFAPQVVAHPYRRQFKKKQTPASVAGLCGVRGFGKQRVCSA